LFCKPNSAVVPFRRVSLASTVVNHTFIPPPYPFSFVIYLHASQTHETLELKNWVLASCLSGDRNTTHDFWIHEGWTHW
jgi:hypothetical protein